MPQYNLASRIAYNPPARFDNRDMPTNPLPDISVSVQAVLVDGEADVPPTDWCVATIRHGLAQILAPDSSGQVSLLITDDETVRDLNREYRGLDQTTDVLSFSAQHSGHWEGAANPEVSESDWPSDWPLPDDEPPPLGDIVVSLPQAKRQAFQQGVPLRRELALLLVHGALHLLGHDHYEDDERETMQHLERAALDAIFGARGG